MAYLFRFVLLCIPLLGAVAATAEAQRIDRSGDVEETSVAAQAQPEMVLALNAATTVIPATTATDAIVSDQLISARDVVSGAGAAGAGLPVCLALVLLVTLIRQRS
ncbi:MAG: hypothetical protein ACPGSC_00105 [Granulosicoccaceae bacterium]